LGSVETSNLIILESENEGQCEDDSIQLVLHHWIDDSTKIGELLSREYYQCSKGKILSGCVFNFLDIDEDESIAMLRQKCIEQGAKCVDHDFSDATATYTICNFISEPSDDSSRFDYCSPFWVYRLLLEGRFVPPHHPLDFPIPMEPIELNRSDRLLVISSTGFPIKERELIEAMVTLAGAIFTPHLSCQNTHLIVPIRNENSLPNTRCSTEKEKFALERGIEIRDVAWLERCFLNWKWE
jgi:hypothetical protein